MYSVSVAEALVADPNKDEETVIQITATVKKVLPIVLYEGMCYVSIVFIFRYLLPLRLGLRRARGFSGARRQVHYGQPAE